MTSGRSPSVTRGKANDRGFLRGLQAQNIRLLRHFFVDFGVCVAQPRGTGVDEVPTLQRARFSSFLLEWKVTRPDAPLRRGHPGLGKKRIRSSLPPNRSGRSLRAQSC